MLRKVVVFIGVFFSYLTVATAQNPSEAIAPEIKTEKITIDIHDPGIEQDFQLSSGKNKKVVIELRYRFQKIFGSFLKLQSKKRFKIKGTHCSNDPEDDVKLGQVFSCQVKLLNADYMEVRELLIKTSTSQQKFYYSTF